jgi:molybdopterin/thiamine biosynthesis adenylyltransferase
MKHPLIIGAGGVASYLLPVLLKSFRPEKLTIVDKDILEERNLDRQMFEEDSIGQNKAVALINQYSAIYTRKGSAKGCHAVEFTCIESWFTAETPVPDDIDAIICCADNHMARFEAAKLAHTKEISAYIGGNEYLDSQALVYHAMWAGTTRDPLIRYPNIRIDHTGSPTACTGEATVSSPQLAVANMNCAAKLLHLMWVYERWLPTAVIGKLPSEREEIINNLPVELFTSLVENVGVN